MHVTEGWLGWGLPRGEDAEFTIMVAGLDMEQGRRVPRPGWHRKSQVLPVWCVCWGWVGELARQVSNGGAACVQWGPLARPVSRVQRPLSRAR